MIAQLIKAEDVERVYSGRPGCYCGCRGDYKESPKAISRMVNKFNKNLDIVDAIDDEKIFTIEWGTRVNSIYLKGRTLK